MFEELKNVIEAILFAIGRNVSVKEFSETLEMEEKDILKAIELLKEEYSEKKGISLVYVNSGYQLVSNKSYFEYVSKFIQNTKKQTLSNTCMEVLSIIAYNPKITKSEIEKIRGTNSDSQVSRLIEYGLIEEVGRLQLPGRPAIFSVTNEFLRSMGISSLEDLPEFDVTKLEVDEISLFDEESNTRVEKETEENKSVEENN